MNTPRLLAVSVGVSAPLGVRARGGNEAVASAIVKHPVSTVAQPDAVAVGRLGVTGDEQVDQSVHGGLDKAVYVYPIEHYAFWNTVRGQAGLAPLPPAGALGENLTVEGLLEGDVYVGDVLSVGEVELRVESPRAPCFKFNAHLGFSWASKMMVQSGYTGFYCAVVRPGRLAAGQPVLKRVGDRVVSIEQMHRLKHRSPQSRLF
ncbi:MAG TPA: MOSC domain-containing protein [Quisquiliibacterium sp.]|nr:MOSC domain-containing protein [Quisquiliibacterium sp.]